MNKSEAINELAAALSKAQSEMAGAVKDSKNPFFKSNYADLESVWNAARGPLSRNGLAVVQTTEVADGQFGVLTVLLHTSGQWISGFYPLNPIKNDPQSVGSAMTYARRYALAAMVGVVQTDDDGEGAMNREESTLFGLKRGNGAVIIESAVAYARSLGGEEAMGRDKKPSPPPVGVTHTPKPAVIISNQQLERWMGPEQPMEGDGVIPPGFIVKYGPCAGKLLHQCDPVVLRTYILAQEASYKKNKNAPGLWFLELVKHAEPYIAAWERSVLATEGGVD